MLQWTIGGMCLIGCDLAKPVASVTGLRTKKIPRLKPTLNGNFSLGFVSRASKIQTNEGDIGAPEERTCPLAETRIFVE
jgi:hypothetical protein